MIESISVSLVGEIVELLVGIVDFESIVGKTFDEKNTKTIEHILENFMMHTKTPNYQQGSFFYFITKLDLFILTYQQIIVVLFQYCSVLMQCFEEFLI